MNLRETNFLVTLVFDEDTDIRKQVNTEHSFKNEIVKDLQYLVRGKEIKHFVVADDAVINEKLKQNRVGIITYKDCDNRCTGGLCTKHDIAVTKDFYCADAERRE